jgi:hypothetical protein
LTAFTLTRCSDDGSLTALRVSPSFAALRLLRSSFPSALLAKACLRHARSSLRLPVK